MNTEVLCVPAITVICLLIGKGIKTSPLDDKWIPTICGVCGAILGAVAMTVMPEYPAHDYLSAIAVGIASGLGATGVHQVYKQLFDREEVQSDD